MAEIRGFCGVRYDAASIGAPLAELVAPPYDVISPDEQASLYARHPKNVVRLILGQGDDKYQNAAKLFREWLADGTLTTDAAEAVYVYRQSFADPVTGAACPERVGLVCLLKLEEYSAGTVLPHENTLTAAKADRLELLRATEAQFESIYGLFSDPDGAVQAFLKEYDDREPVMEQVDNAIGSTHAVERIADENAIETLRNLMQGKQIFIADGHHRYETALNYRREARASQSTGEAIAADYILITLTAFEDAGLLVLPTHRLVKGVSPEAINGLRDSLAAEFEMEETAAGGAAGLEAAILAKARAGRTAFGVILPDGTFVATLKTEATETEAVKRLPVTLLHTQILERRLGIGADALAAGEQVAYTRDAAEAAAGVESGAWQAAFVLGRPQVSEVRDVSLAGDKMPQKSTFFFPKLLSGLLLRDLRRAPESD